MDEALANDFPISSKQISRVIDGIPTELVVTEFSNTIFIAVTQVGSLGQMALATKDTGPSSDILDPSTTLVKTLLGQREDPTLHIFASQILHEILLSNPRESRKLLLGLGLVKELREEGAGAGDVVEMRRRFLEGVLEGLVEGGVVVEGRRGKVYEGVQGEV
ncbi:hypothetical protein HDU67_001663 [Dinochytrium kinnereticum]|nr:hypothetical protein HDU67_001663 [Dinochytrium kinnereticum]